MRRSLIPLMCIAIVSCQPRKADVVFMNANIWTVEKSQPRAQAVAVHEGRIIAVGTNEAIQALIAPTTKIVDVKGRLLLPGFIDNHTHFVDGGFQLGNIDLQGTKDEQEFVQRIKQWAETHQGEWITGGGWTRDQWPGRPLPSRSLIDSVTRDTPVNIINSGGHMSLANSYALKLAGITRDTPDPPGGLIDKDPTSGEPTGILKNDAIGLVNEKMPSATEDETLYAIRSALAEARRNGITSIQDVANWAAVEAYGQLEASNELTLRVHCRLPIVYADSLVKYGLMKLKGDRWVQSGMVKAFVDGTLGSTTALLLSPYNSDSTVFGTPGGLVVDGRLKLLAMEADKNNLQISVHAVGDSAVRWSINLCDSLVARNGPRDRRFRVEHSVLVQPGDYDRFSRLNVIASVQPAHVLNVSKWIENTLGAERSKNLYPFRSLLDKGVTVCFGSDWPYGSLSPFLGIYAAVTRITKNGEHPEGWLPEQRITVQEAIEAYTLKSAYAVFEENEKGSIAVGKLADFVVLSEDILSINPREIEKVQVDLTVVGGKIVYTR